MVVMVGLITSHTFHCSILLVGGGNSTYRVLKINGKNAQHSKLHENSQVDKALIKFVWNK